MHRCSRRCGSSTISHLSAPIRYLFVLHCLQWMLLYDRKKVVNSWQCLGTLAVAISESFGLFELKSPKNNPQNKTFRYCAEKLKYIIESCNFSMVKVLFIYNDKRNLLSIKYRIWNHDPWYRKLLAKIKRDKCLNFFRTTRRIDPLAYRPRISYD